MEELTNQRLYEVIEQLVERRMNNTGETKAESINHIMAYLTSRIEDDAA